MLKKKKYKKMIIYVQKIMFITNLQMFMMNNLIA